MFSEEAVDIFKAGVSYLSSVISGCFPSTLTSRSRRREGTGSSGYTEETQLNTQMTKIIIERAKREQDILLLDYCRFYTEHFILETQRTLLKGTCRHLVVRREHCS